MDGRLRANKILVLIISFAFIVLLWELNYLISSKARVEVQSQTNHIIHHDTIEHEEHQSTHHTIEVVPATSLKTSKSLVTETAKPQPKANISKLSTQDKLELLDEMQWKGLNTLLNENVNSENQIILLTVNRGFADMLMNWLCSIKDIPELKNIVFYSMDESLSNELNAAGYNAYSPEEALVLFGSEINSDLSYGSLPYGLVLLLRTYFIRQCLHLGYNVLTADIDAVWSENPLLEFSLDQYSSADILAPMDTPHDTTACGGLVYLKNTPRTLNLWDSLSNDYRKRIVKGYRRGGMSSPDENDQELLSQLIKNKRNIKFTFLDKNRFPSGKYYFDMKGPQSNKITPVVIHNNWVVGGDVKRKRFKDNQLWFVKDNFNWDHKTSCNN